MGMMSFSSNFLSQALLLNCEPLSLWNFFGFPYMIKSMPNSLFMMVHFETSYEVQFDKFCEDVDGDEDELVFQTLVGKGPIRPMARCSFFSLQVIPLARPWSGCYLVLYR